MPQTLSQSFCLDRSISCWSQAFPPPNSSDLMIPISRNKAAMMRNTTATNTIQCSLLLTHKVASALSRRNGRPAVERTEQSRDCWNGSRGERPSGTDRSLHKNSRINPQVWMVNNVPSPVETGYLRHFPGKFLLPTYCILLGWKLMNSPE